MNMQPMAAATTGETSAASFKGVSSRQLKTLNDELLELVVGAQRNGCKDLSMRELQQAYEHRHNKRIEMSSISGAISRMVTAGTLVRDAVPRACNITQRDILPFCAPAKQGSFL